MADKGGPAVATFCADGGLTDGSYGQAESIKKEPDVERLRSVAKQRGLDLSSHVRRVLLRSLAAWEGRRW